MPEETWGTFSIYDHRDDASEWHNLAGNPKYAGLKERLKKQLPEVNAPWSPMARQVVGPACLEGAARHCAAPFSLWVGPGPPVVASISSAETRTRSLAFRMLPSST